MENPMHVSGPSPFKVGDGKLKVGDKKLQLTGVKLKPPKQRLTTSDSPLKLKRKGRGDAVINRYASIKINEKPTNIDKPRRNWLGARRKNARILM